jgi:arylsulfatase A-like enzyme
VDLLPTLLETLNIEVDHEISGVSVLSDERSADESARLVFSETNSLSGRRFLRAVIWRNFKLVYDQKTNRHQLFDLLRDPRETKDVQRENEATASRLHDALLGWMQREGANAGAPANVEMTETEKQRLRSLGYLQ